MLNVKCEMETVNGKLPEHLRSAVNSKQDSELARLSTNGAQETVNRNLSQNLRAALDVDAARQLAQATLGTASVQPEDLGIPPRGGDASHSTLA